jgi:hypothetical protein
MRWVVTVVAMGWIGQCHSAGLEAAPPRVVVAEDWNTRFTLPVAASDQPLQWLGGDAVYGTSLDHQRSLLLFADTFYGSFRHRDRAGSSMLRNSIAIVDREANVQFVVGRVGEQPASFFRVADEASVSDGRESRWLWPAAAGLDGHSLCIQLWEMRHHPGAGVFSFAIHANHVALIDDHGKDPHQWTIEIKPLPAIELGAAVIEQLGSDEPSEALDGGRSDRLQTPQIHQGSALLRIPKYCFRYSVVTASQGAKTALLVERIGEGELGQARQGEWYAGHDASTGEPRWERDPRHAVAIADRVAVELSVSHDAARNRYLMIHAQEQLGASIIARTATSPWGPWSPPMAVYSCPEPESDRKVFAYAAKAHPELSDENELLISYATNSFDFPHAVQTPTLYVPRFIRLDLESLDTQPPVTQPPDTQPPDTQPPDTQPPDTQPPDTQPPARGPLDR